MKLLIFVFSLMTALTGPPVEAPLAAGGCDPVLLAAGREESGESELTVVYGGRSYRFVSIQTRAAFERAPDTYLNPASPD